MDYELQAEKVGRLDRELNDLTSSSKDDNAVMSLKRLKTELEAKIADQEEELDDQAGSIQQLEQVWELLIGRIRDFFFVIIFQLKKIYIYFYFFWNFIYPGYTS